MGGRWREGKENKIIKELTHHQVHINYTCNSSVCLAVTIHFDGHFIPVRVSLG